MVFFNIFLFILIRRNANLPLFNPVQYQQCTIKISFEKNKFYIYFNTLNTAIIFTSFLGLG